METIQGTITAVIYQSEDSGYTVLRVAQEIDGVPGGLVTVVGIIPFAAPGEHLEAGGRWVEHPAHGRQFSAESVHRSLPETAEAILDYLSAGAVNGVGKSTAALLVDYFGDDTLTILAGDPTKLSKVPGITPRRAAKIREGFNQKNRERRLMEFLAANNLSAGYALELIKQYGDDAEVRLRQDPYVLLFDPCNAPFAAVDAFAAVCEIEPNDTRRGCAGLLYILHQNLAEGHSYLPRDRLLASADTLLHIPDSLLAMHLQTLLDEHKLTDGVDSEGIYLTALARAEQSVADAINRKQTAKHPLPKDFQKLLTKSARDGGVTYAPLQKEAITAAARRDLLVLTGGPGTGKTTTVRGMLSVFDALGRKTLLCAPTGRAAKRLAELTGREAVTIHRLLAFGYDQSRKEMRFMRDAADPLKCDVLIADECSMVDIMLFRSLLDALPPDAKLILIGDPDQLPSVGAGNVLRDLCDNAATPSVKLTEIFRQAAQSRIVTIAHAVNRGDPVLESNAKTADFFFLQRNRMEDAADTIADLCRNRLPQGMKINPSSIQVLSPTRKGECGTVSLNTRLQAALNPPADHKLEKKHGDRVFREGDRVMQIRNNYDLAWSFVNSAGNGQGVFNGEIGTVTEISHAEETLAVQFDDRLCAYPFDTLLDLEPAYAMTVHKSQGSEYSAVVLSLMPGAPQLMTRRVLYTALTRAKDLLICVGQREVFAAMTANDRQLRRYSGLGKRLTDSEQ